MQNKLVPWINLTAYLPVILLQLLSLAPFSTGPATVYAASACACGCVVSAEESCCCGCPSDVESEDREKPGSFTSVKTSDSQSRRCLLSPVGCSPVDDNWVLPAPLPDHLKADSMLCVAGQPPVISLPGCKLSPPGAPPGNPEKVPI